jgi:hypothetical protein
VVVRQREVLGFVQLSTLRDSLHMNCIDQADFDREGKMTPR